MKRIDDLVARNRDQCLWFWRDDFVPADDHMRMKALEYIQRHGTREAARSVGSGRLRFHHGTLRGVWPKVNRV